MVRGLAKPIKEDLDMTSGARYGTGLRRIRNICRMIAFLGFVDWLCMEVSDLKERRRTRKKREA